MNMKILSCILLLLSCVMAHSQTQERTSKSKKANEAYDAGVRYYSLRNFDAAITQLQSAIQSDPRFIEAYLMLGQVYEDNGNPMEAISAYQKGLAINEKFYPGGLLTLAGLQFNEGYYNEALQSYTRFISLNSGHSSHKALAQRGIRQCEYALNAIKNPVDFKPVNLGPSINSNLDEYWPALSADEKTLMITRLIPDTDVKSPVQEDFFISEWADTGWTPIRNIGKPLNSDDNEGAQSISGDGRYMVFTACNKDDGKGRCDLYASVRTGDNWSVPVNLGSPVNTNYRETQPSLSSDGRTLYFSSDRPGGKGQHDIWVTCKNDKGLWSVPENIGEPVNTPGTEISPFIHGDMQTLYFSSDGHPGMGGYDLYLTRKDSSDKWQTPANLGYPINSNRDEIGLIVNSRGNWAYYASDMVKERGQDIYKFELPEYDRPLPVTYLKGKVFDARNFQPLRAVFELIDLESGEQLYHSFSDSITGEFLVSIPVDRNYMLNASRKGYLFYSENFALKNGQGVDKPFLKDVPLQPLIAGNRIILKNVFFETDSYALKKESTLELDKVVQFLKTNPAIKIEIGGHTDQTGTVEYNRTLSENRAKSVTEYLISSSINPARIISKGYGMSVPIADNNSEEGRALNRRTEMKIIE